MTPSRRPSHPRKRCDEDGSVSVFVVGMFTALIVVAGLVFDGGNIIAANREADAEAEGAARAAAEQIAPAALHAGYVAIDPAAAQTAATRYLAAYHHTGTAVTDGDNVTVTVTYQVPMQILTVVGVHTKTVTGTGTATAIEAPNP